MLKPGDIIKKARTEKKISIRSLSSLSGVSHTEISKIEKGIRINPNPNNLLKISDALNIDYNYLLKLSGYMPNKSSLNTNSNIPITNSKSSESLIALKRRVASVVSSEIRERIDSEFNFNENYMINSKVIFDFIGFTDTVEVFCCNVEDVTDIDLINFNSIKSTFADFYFNFKHTFDDSSIHFIASFVVKNRTCYDELDMILKNLFNHFRPNFEFRIYLLDEIQ